MLDPKARDSPAFLVVGLLPIAILLGFIVKEAVGDAAVALTWERQNATIIGEPIDTKTGTRKGRRYLLYAQVQSSNGRWVQEQIVVHRQGSWSKPMIVPAAGQLVPVHVDGRGGRMVAHEELLSFWVALFWILLLGVPCAMSLWKLAQLFDDWVSGLTPSDRP
ncbi:hypothetical protein JMJ55_15875 [Belnapia sp. T6]|uniref:DUF3592 domain-containing protein n=1 Tax=Belnapia mucosa TaxID=2804532 RepID=A0ABS1V6Q2_9PROT|nr:hypothetical protein [Belnapia mucosa]MBL6456816.1 hypothetical protein [Belnapia mucosa]